MERIESKGKVTYNRFRAMENIPLGYSPIDPVWHTIWSDPNNVLAEFYNTICDNVCFPCQITKWRPSNDRSVIKESVYIIDHREKGSRKHKLSSKGTWGNTNFLSIGMFHWHFIITAAAFVAVPLSHLIPSSLWCLLNETFGTSPTLRFEYKNVWRWQKCVIECLCSQWH